MREIYMNDLAEALEQGIQLVDVREPAEYAEGHVPGSRNVPMGQLSSRLDSLDRDHPVLLICWSGNRSRAMCDLVSAAGYDAVNVGGGTAAWIRSGRPVEAGVR